MEEEVTFELGMPGYVLRDWEVVDYQCYSFPETDLWFRGPSPFDDVGTLGSSYFAAVGAAQTFGCFCEKPYPVLLEERLGLKSVNLGYSGAGPAFFRKQDKLIETINNGKFCILQVMSGRSSENSKFRNPNGLAHGEHAETGASTTAELVFQEAIVDSYNAYKMPLPKRYRNAIVRRLALPLTHVDELVRESKKNWLVEYHELIQRIKVPIVLHWFSTRAATYSPVSYSVPQLLGEFPHLINDELLSDLQRRTDASVISTSMRGRPQKLVSRFTGQSISVDLEKDLKPVPKDPSELKTLYQGKWSENKYYPSPEMHLDAADDLAPVCQKFLK